MSAQLKKDDTLQEKASTLPLELVTAMAQADGPDEGGLTLTREHIITLNKYANFVLRLPGNTSSAEKWLGYTTIKVAELTPANMQVLFDSLHAHARTWRPLSDKSKSLSIHLALVANSINSGGNFILAQCNKMLDEEIPGVASWRDIELADWGKIKLAEPTKLHEQQIKKLKRVEVFMDNLGAKVDEYAARVDEVLQETTVFRDVAIKQLVPGVYRKIDAVERQKGSGEVEKLRQELKDLDNDISRCNSEYDRYVKAAMSGMAGGPLGLVITGGIYGKKAEDVRKERKRHQATRRDVAEKLRVELNLEGRMEELGTSMSELNSRLQDVITAASYLRTAWETVGLYIEKSKENLTEVQTDEDLFLFSYYFGEFLAQWKDIERHALQMTRIFDEATAAQ